MVSVNVSGRGTPNVVTHPPAGGQGVDQQSINDHPNVVQPPAQQQDQEELMAQPQEENIRRFQIKPEAWGCGRLLGQLAERV